MRWLASGTTSPRFGSDDSARRRLRVAPGPDGDPLQRQAHLRRDEPRCVILVLRPDVAHRKHCAVALDRPARLLCGLLERRSVLPELKARGQGHVERLMSRWMLALRHSCEATGARAAVGRHRDAITCPVNRMTG